MTIIYAFTYKPEYEGFLKVGETTRSVNKRLKQNIQMPSEPCIELSIECGDLSDHDVHRELKKMGKQNINGEWFECTKEDVIQAILNAKGIWVKDEGVYTNKELINYINETHENIEGSEKLDNIAFLLQCCTTLGIEDVATLKDALSMCNKIKEDSSTKVLDAISKYGIKKLEEYYDTIFEKIEKVNDFNIQEVMQNKAAVNSFLKVYDTCKKDTNAILGELNTLNKLLEENKIDGVFTKPLLRNLKYICLISEKLGISEKACLGHVKRIVDSFMTIMKETNCSNLHDLRSLIEIHEKYRAHKERIDAYINQIQGIFKELGVKSIDEFWGMAKKIEKERKKFKSNLAKSMSGEELDSDVIKSLENKIFEYGKHSGETYKQVIEKDREYIEWLLDNSIETVQIFPILLEQRKKDKREEKMQLKKKSAEDVRGIISGLYSEVC